MSLPIRRTTTACICTIGIARDQAKLTLANLAYNFDQGSEMLTHQALEMLKRRTGLIKAR
jgi:hypothetical protein